MTKEAGYKAGVGTTRGIRNPECLWSWQYFDDHHQGQVGRVDCQPENKMTPALLSFDDMTVWPYGLRENHRVRVRPSLTSNPVPDRMAWPEKLAPWFRTADCEVRDLLLVWVPARLSRDITSSRSIAGFLHSGNWSRFRTFRRIRKPRLFGFILNI